MINLFGIVVFLLSLVTPNIGLSAIDKPDFVVTKITLVPSSPEPGTKFKAKVKVKNTGAVAGDAGKLRVWKNTQKNPSCKTKSGRSKSIGMLSPGEKKVVTIKGLKMNKEGSKILRAFIDGTCLTSESKEGNNKRKKIYTVVSNSIKDSQTIEQITFSTDILPVDGSTTAIATASSGLEVTFSTTTPTICSVSGSTVSGIAEGTCTIVADQSGDEYYKAAPQVTGSISVGNSTNTGGTGNEGTGSGKWVMSKITGDNYQQTFSYDSNGNLVNIYVSSEITGDGYRSTYTLTTRNTLNSEGQVIRSNSTNKSYYNGQVSETTYTTSYTYDGKGNEIRSVTNNEYGYTATATSQYDSHNNIVRGESSTTTNGYTSTNSFTYSYVYDENGNVLTKTLYFDGDYSSRTDFSYNSIGIATVKFTDYNGSITTTTCNYDLNGNLATSVTNGSVTTYTWIKL